MTAIATTLRHSGRRRHLRAVRAATVRTEPLSEPLSELRWSPLVIRLSVASDGAKLRRLAHMDSALPLSGQTLLAEQGGSLVAALSLDDGAAIADPFVASADAVAVLRIRAAQLNRSAATAA